MEALSFEERVVATTVASLSKETGNKRGREESTKDIVPKAKKAARKNEPAGPVKDSSSKDDASKPPVAQISLPVLKPYPFFFYNDFSTEKDPDSLTPLTPPGRVPNFPAKMHSILSRPDLADVIAWMPHGRSWRVLKPREFEIRVIPTYFEHAKFSSFIRQANGWGFRRITQGRDRNSYYHEQFLRGLPHLCKQMKRPGVSQKQAADPDHEPDLYKVSEIHPVPDKAEDDSILLHCTLQGGPKARMPIYSGALKKSSEDVVFSTTKDIKMPTIASLSVPRNSVNSKLTPHDTEALQAFQRSLGASEHHVANSRVSRAPMPVLSPHMPLPGVPPSLSHSFYGMPSLSTADKMNPLATANHLAFSSPPSYPSQFAAGFAAAAAMNQQQMHNMMFGSMAGIPPMDFLRN